MTIDRELAEKARAEKCPHCQNALHSAFYIRKSRSHIESPLPEEWHVFYSLCCSAEGCRRRVRPQSLRHAGRSPHSAGLILLAGLLRSGGSARSVLTLCSLMDVSERTVRRWLRFWKCVCRGSRWWKELSARFSVSGKTLGNLFSRMGGNLSGENALRKLLVETLSLWGEVRLTVGDRIPAEDA